MMPLLQCRGAGNCAPVLFPKGRAGPPFPAVRLNEASRRIVN